MQVKSLVRVALVAALSLPATLAAQTSFVASRDLFSGTTLNWLTLYGPNGSEAGGAATATGVPGVTVSSTGGSSLTVLQQSNGWSGNFTPGEPVIYGDGPLSFLFNVDVFGMGANVQANLYGGFTGIISAYDAANTLLGSYSLAGTSDGNSDGSAVFMGIRSDAGMRRVTFALQGGGTLGINQATLEALPQTAVPEPGTYLLVATGLAAVAAMKRRRRA